MLLLHEYDLTVGLVLLSDRTIGYGVLDECVSVNNNGQSRNVGKYVPCTYGIRILNIDDDFNKIFTLRGFCYVIIDLDIKLSV